MVTKLYRLVARFYGDETTIARPAREIGKKLSAASAGRGPGQRRAG